MPNIEEGGAPVLHRHDGKLAHGPNQEELAQHVTVHEIVGSGPTRRGGRDPAGYLSSTVTEVIARAVRAMYDQCTTQPPMLSATAEPENCRW